MMRRTRKRRRQSITNPKLDQKSLADTGRFSYARGSWAPIRELGVAKALSLPMRLALLVAGTTLPLIIFRGRHRFP